MNLRCIAHFGFSPDFWLTTFTESIFMLYLGTIYDPRITWNSPEYSAKFINDILYNEVEKIRSDCGLAVLEGRGLNRTWSLIQGWHGVGIHADTECVNCKRITPDLTEPSWRRSYWSYADPTRPSPSHVICSNCTHYQKTHGKPRSLLLEEKRLTCTYAEGENPGLC
jgi:hypothetical protein